MILIIKLNNDGRNLHEISKFDTNEQAILFLLNEIKSGTDISNIRIFSASELKLTLIEE